MSRAPSCLPRLLFATLFAAGVVTFFPTARGASTPAQHAALAEEQASRGAFESAITEWKKAAETARGKHDQPALIDALAQLGGTYHSLGQHRLALKALGEAEELAKASKDQPRRAAVLSEIGAIETLSRNASGAEEKLREAVKIARGNRDDAALAPILNNLGDLLAAQESNLEALTTFGEAISLAEDKSLAAKARISLANATVASGNFAHAAALNEAAIKAAQALPDSHDKAFALLRGGKTWELLFEKAPEHENRHRADALRIYQMAAGVAENIGDDRALSYALGYAGRLYEQEKKYAEALRLTRRAAFLAQKARSPDALYQWEWQTARIDAAGGRRDDAIADYRRAIKNLELIRNDLTIRLGNPNAHSSFRIAVGDIFFELADLLLQRADGLHDEKAVTAALIEARDTCELLKSVELEDYFQDDCVNLLQSKKKTIEGISETAAVIYLVPLRDRTELLVSLKSGLQRVKSPVGAAELTATIRDFRVHLETRTTFEYLAEAAQLYTWLIKPLEPMLAAHKIDTLVFVPDGALRTIPMAALHDGEKFLIEKFAIAVTPGLTLMEPTPIKRANVSLMINGLSQPVTRNGEQFAALPFVEKEIGSLKSIYGTKALMNGDFLTENVTRQFAAQPYSIVHIASHGEFSGDVKKTFVLTYDGQLSLNQLEQMIRPSQLRDQPVELLSLSACQTAAGDDRAALGLAGIAIKAGARSAFATLWFVNDEASTNLIVDFYTALHTDPNLSKAKALQRAQIKLLTNPRYSHPCLWAPYLIIGNWL